MKSRPNKNYILQVMRDGDFDDSWGTTMAWAFAVAENLYAIGAEIPDELEYTPSPLGAVIESYEDFTVQEYLGVNSGLTLSRVEEVQQAGKIIARYIDWLRAAGKDY